MPELPEVETTLQAIKKFKNQNLNDVKIYNRNLRWKVNKNLEKKSRFSRFPTSFYKISWGGVNQINTD